MNQHHVLAGLKALAFEKMAGGEIHCAAKSRDGELFAAKLRDLRDRRYGIDRENPRMNVGAKDGQIRKTLQLGDDAAGSAAGEDVDLIGHERGHSAGRGAHLNHFHGQVILFEKAGVMRRPQRQERRRRRRVSNAQQRRRGAVCINC